MNSRTIFMASALAVVLVAGTAVAAKAAKGPFNTSLPPPQPNPEPKAATVTVPRPTVAAKQGQPTQPKQTSTGTSSAGKKQRGRPTTAERNAKQLATLQAGARLKVKRMLAKAKKQGIILLLTSAYRDCVAQNALYAKGRTKPGRKVTNAKCGQSWHNIAVAVDVVEVKGGKALWDNPRWTKIGEIGESVGLKWGGRWKSFKDRPHFYDAPDGMSLAQMWDKRKAMGLA